MSEIWGVARLASFFIVSDDEELAVKDEEVSEETYLSTEPGATCRKCGAFNEYAYADR